MCLCFLAFGFHLPPAWNMDVMPRRHLVSMREKEPTSSAGQTPALSSTSRLLVPSVHSFREYYCTISDSWHSSRYQGPSRDKAKAPSSSRSHFRGARQYMNKEANTRWKGSSGWQDQRTRSAGQERCYTKHDKKGTWEGLKEDSAQAT